MMKKLALALAPGLALSALLSACADEPEVVAQPDPALIERIVAANAAEPVAPEKLEKLEKADKLVAAVAHVEPDRVEGVAEKLLAR